MENRERLIQEDYIDTENGPWKVLVICQCLNLASWKQAEPVIKKIFERFPSPQHLAENLDPVIEDLVYEMLKPLGLGIRRTRNIFHMSVDFAKEYMIREDEYRYYPISDFDGCGPYAQDAWNLFVLKIPTNPKDIHLRRYAEKAGLLLDSVST